MASLADRLEGELRGKQPDLRATVAALTGGQVTTLNLDHTNGGNLENSGLTDAFVSLKKLSLNGVGLTTLKNLPVLPQLRKLELADNRLSSTLDRLPVACKLLTHLYLANNRFKDIASLDALKSLKHLRVLNIDSNPVANDGAYRQALFSLIPNLAYVDEEDREGNPPPSEEEDESDEDEEGEGDEEEGDEDDDGEDDAAQDEEAPPAAEGEEADEQEDEGEEGEEEPGLDYLTKDINDEEDDGGEFEPQEEVEEEDAGEEEEEEEEEEEAHQNKRPRKR